MLPTGGRGGAAGPGTAASIQAAQLQALHTMRSMGGFPGPMYGFPSPYPQGIKGGSGMMMAGAPGGYGTYSGWGGSGFGGGYAGGAKGSGRGKGKGKGKGWKGGAPPFSETDWLPEGDPRRQIEIAQRRAKQRDRAAIAQAQRSAQLRFESDVLSRVQGHWIDESDPSTTYFVEGGQCTVSGGENTRTFRNRISVYNGELCWDARRFWHNLNLNALPPAGEEVYRVEWLPAEGSPAAATIVWVRGSSLDGANILSPPVVPEDLSGDVHGTVEEAVAEDNAQEPVS